MAVQIGSARIDERGKISGGAAGNQTGKELSTQNWYLHSKGWRVLRPKDYSKARKMAECMCGAGCVHHWPDYMLTQLPMLINPYISFMASVWSVRKQDHKTHIFRVLLLVKNRWLL